MALKKRGNSVLSTAQLATVTLFASLFSGMSIAWDRRFGFLNTVLSTPVARGSIILSKVFSTVIRALIQVALVLFITYLFGLTPGLDFTVISLLGVFAALFLVSVGSLQSSFSSPFDPQDKKPRWLNLLLLFTSSALYPISIMPDWLQFIAKMNPMSYAIDAARQLVLYMTDTSQLIMDFTFLGIFAAVFAGIGIILSWRFLSK